MGGAAAVNISEVDISTRVASFEGVYGGIVVQAKKGRTDQPIFVTSDTQLLSYTTPDSRIEVGYDSAYYSALAYISRSNKLWVMRAVNTAYYAGLSLVTENSANNNVPLPSSTNMADPTAYAFGTDECLLLYGANEGAWANDIGVRITTITQDPDLVEPYSFQIEVFKTSNQSVALETFLCSRVLGQKNQAGTNLFVEDVLLSSQYIRAFSNPLVDGTTLPKGVINAVAATATYSGATFTADTAGTDGDSISLVFDGTSDVGTIVNAWNTSNPSNTVSFSGAASTDVLAASTVTLTGGAAAQNDVIEFLSDGDDGQAVADNNMISALDNFSNKSQTSLTILMDGGYTTESYQQAMDAVCQSRQDCVAILSTPADKEDSATYMTDLVAYRKTTLNLNSSYSALYTPHLQIADRFNDRDIYVSPDGYVAGSISLGAKNYEIWYPMAGFKRGIIDVKDTKIRFEEGEMDLLYNAQINPIRFFPGRGIVVWGQKTLQTRASALDRLNVRLLLIVIEPAIKTFLENFLFDINDTNVRTIIQGQLEGYLNTIKAKKGVTDFEVVCDSTNNTSADIDANRLNVDIFIKPGRSIEDIPVRVVITPTGVSFSNAASLV